MKMMLQPNPRVYWDEPGEKSGGGEAAPDAEGAAAAAAESEDQPTDGNGFADIADLLNLGDRKVEEEAKPGEETPPSSKAPPEGGKEEQEGDLKAKAEGEPAPAPKPGEEVKPKEGEGDAGAELKKLLTDVLKEAKGPEEKPKEPPKPEYTPKYGGVQIPDQIMAAIEHEDPKVRRQGLGIMIGAAMTKVYDDLKADFAAALDTKFKEVPNVIQTAQAQQESMKQIAADFYGTYKQFDTPAARKLVPVVAMQLAQAEGQNYKGWTKEFRDKLGAYLIELTGLKTAPTAEPKPGTKPAGKPAGTFVAGTAARPATAGEKTLADEIAETIAIH